MILALHDHPDDETPGSFIADHGCTPDALERAGLVSRIGVFDVVLLDDELFGDHRATVTPVRAGDAVLEPGADLGGPDVAREDVVGSDGWPVGAGDGDAERLPGRVLRIERRLPRTIAVGGHRVAAGTAGDMHCFVRRGEAGEEEKIVDAN